MLAHPVDVSPSIHFDVSPSDVIPPFNLISLVFEAKTFQQTTKNRLVSKFDIGLKIVMCKQMNTPGKDLYQLLLPIYDPKRNEAFSFGKISQPVLRVRANNKTIKQNRKVISKYNSFWYLQNRGS